MKILSCFFSSISLSIRGNNCFLWTVASVGKNKAHNYYLKLITNASYGG